MLMNNSFKTSKKWILIKLIYEVAYSYLTMASSTLSEGQDRPNAHRRAGNRRDYRNW